MSISHTLTLAATILALASAAAAQTSAAKDEPTPGMEPVVPVMDRPILAHVIFSQLEGRWNGTNTGFRWDASMAGPDSWVARNTASGETWRRDRAWLYALLRAAEQKD